MQRNGEFGVCMHVGRQYVYKETVCVLVKEERVEIRMCVRTRVRTRVCSVCAGREFVCV